MSKNRFDGLIKAATQRVEEEPPRADVAVPAKAKSKDPNYLRTTVYLPRTLHQRVKLAALQEGMEISDMAAIALEAYLASKHSNA